MAGRPWWRRPVVLIAGAVVGIAGLALGGLALAGLVSLPGSQPGPPPELRRFYDQQLAWRGCAEFAGHGEERDWLSAAPSAECTHLLVPLDYARPEGRTAQVAVIRQKARGASTERIGSLVIEPGTDGHSAILQMLPVMQRVSEERAAQQIGRRFDLVGFDPRGVGASTPAVRCWTAAEMDADRLDNAVDHSPAGVARTEAELRDDVARCEQGSGGRDVLANLGTRDVACDLDILRAALGDAQLNLLSRSGGEVAISYLERFPTSLRALVLDNASDPNASTADSVVEQSQAFQRAFDAFANACAREPNCPIGQNPGTATQNYRKLVLPLIDRPLPLPGGRRLSYSDAIVGTQDHLYGAEGRADLRQALTDLAAGNGTTLMAAADGRYGRRPDGSYTAGDDAFLALRCVNTPAITDSAQSIELARRMQQAEPYADDGRGPSPARDACGFWPVPATATPHVPQTSDELPSILLIAVTGSTGVPFQAGVNLANTLKARLLTVEGNQTGAVLQNIACVDNVVGRYLIDPVAGVPPVGARCYLPTE